MVKLGEIQLLSTSEPEWPSTRPKPMTGLGESHKALSRMFLSHSAA